MTEKEKNLGRPPKPPLSLLVLLILLLGFSVFHSLQSRSLTDILLYSMYTYALIVFAAFAISIYFWYKRGYPKPTFNAIFSALFVIIPLFFVAIFYSMVGSAIYDLYLWAQSPELSQQYKLPFFVSGALLCGYILFSFRMRLRATYGVTEAAAGVGLVIKQINAETTPAVTDPGFYLAILASGIYLIVRGFDNIHQGITKEPMDPVAQRLTRLPKMIKQALD